MIRAQLEHLNDHPAASQLLIANLGRAGKLPDIAAQVNQGFEEPVRRLLAEGAADGSLADPARRRPRRSRPFGAILSSASGPSSSRATSTSTASSG